MPILAFLLICILAVLALPSWSQSEPFETSRADGYQGIWYSNQPSNDKYVYKYSGGLGTYTAKHQPHFLYAPETNKTFFVYGGSKGLHEKEPLLIMVAYFDHKTGTVPRPAVVLKKGTGDAHHNPTISLDAEGHLWVFASAHGGKDGFIFKSTEPYSIDAFQRIMQKEFTYPQPRFLEGFGFHFLFTKYTAGRELYANTSSNGIEWGEDQKIAGFGGHYQISGRFNNKVSSAFNWHPPKGGLNARTNLYYIETRDCGKTWTTVTGETLEMPLSSPQNAALIREYQKENLLVYMKDLTYDPEGNPVILYVTSQGYESGPENDPRFFTVAHWLNGEWRYHRVCQTDHNYDMGSLYIEENQWKVIAPTAPGPQPYTTGGEIEVWTSQNQGQSWKKTRRLTDNSPHNHTYVRRAPLSHPAFYAFWADGNALKPSLSHLYFTNQDADQVWKLPPQMEGQAQKPILLSNP